MTGLDALDGVPTIPAGLLEPPAGVDLWCFFYDEHLDPARRAAYDALLTDEERARHQRFMFARDRDLFLATRALVRCALSRYARVAPAAWRFERTEHGKPYLVGPPSAPELHFNLSNTYGLVACAVSSTIERVGVDVENTTRGTDAIEIADRFFSELEVKALRALPEQHPRERFFSYWTLKESYIKARGLGLAIPLGHFSFLLDEAPPIAVVFDPRLEDDPERWRFRLFNASDRHTLAVGADTGGADLGLRWSPFVPLAETAP
ncbi:MAG: 4'-phosphopantetheinyl transferase superfamily protein [Polyangiaceae bacterium]